VTVTGNEPGLWEPAPGVCAHCGAKVDRLQCDWLAFGDDDQQVQYKAVLNRYTRWESRY
jgi:hypothetical protein